MWNEFDCVSLLKLHQTFQIWKKWKDCEIQYRKKNFYLIFLHEAILEMEIIFCSKHCYQYIVCTYVGILYFPNFICRYMENLCLQVYVFSMKIFHVAKWIWTGTWRFYLNFFVVLSKKSQSQNKDVSLLTTKYLLLFY